MGNLESLWEDEALTEGLDDGEAQTLLTWLRDLLQDADPEEVPHIRRIGHRVARLAREYGVPVEEGIALVELAWGGEEPRGLEA